MVGLVERVVLLRLVLVAWPVERVERGLGRLLRDMMRTMIRYTILVTPVKPVVLVLRVVAAVVVLMSRLLPVLVEQVASRVPMYPAVTAQMVLVDTLEMVERVEVVCS